MKEQTAELDLFDRFIDQFSARELKTRVWAVVVLGILLMTLAVGGLYFLGTRTFHIVDQPGFESVPFYNLLRGGVEH